jgi:hypothetical protein
MQVEQKDDVFSVRLDYSELGLGEADLVSGIGYRGAEPPPEIRSLMRAVLGSAAARAEIRGGFRRVRDFRPGGDGSVTAGGVRLALGDVLSGQLENATAAAVFTATAGPGLEAWSRELIRQGDVMAGYLADAAASEAVEKASERIQALVGEEARKEGLEITNRYSPGYCGWPLTDQHALFSLLPPGFCGVSLTGSSLMIPLKSVSGIIGLGRSVRFNPYPCALCAMEDCFKRRAGAADPSPVRVPEPPLSL